MRFLLHSFVIFSFVLPVVAKAGTIAVSIAPLHSLVSMVAPDDYRVELLIPGDVSPHGFQLKPSQLRKISR
ncbi:zinc ABC transporter substrate-binding protein, partial [Gammaproteobacteria bacterium]|nr:zinc ABC transporter substrate-binding protein [Gammaproteobacteria bacterium]